MKLPKMGRPAVRVLSAVAVLAVAWLLPPALHKAMHLCPVRPDGVKEAAAFANFARRYGVSCDVCHNSVPQLNSTGYKFRLAGYRMPDEIGKDAKFNSWGDVMSVRLREQYKATGTARSATGTKTPATNGFVNSGVAVYPLAGAFGKYWGAETELDFSAGNTAATKGTVGGVSMNTANLRATVPLGEDMSLGVRAGLMSAFEGYGAADRGVGLLSPGWKPTPSQISPNGTKSYTYTSNPSFTGEGVELGFDWKDTHASVQMTNGFNSFNNSGNQGEDNYLKDFSFFINQMIYGDSAISAFYYNGKTGLNGLATTTNGIAGAETASTPGVATWINNYSRGAVYATIKPIKGSEKLAILAGITEGKDHMLDQTTKNGSDQFNSVGWFGQVESRVHEYFTAALAYGTNRGSTRTAHNRSSDWTLSMAVPWENAKFALDLQTKRVQNPVQTTGVFGPQQPQDTITNTVAAEWMLFF